MNSLGDKDGFIDVQELIARYSAEEHKARADAYFARHSENSAMLRKPFQSIPEATQILQGLGIVLKELKLFQGVRIVDFGAGTAWLSKFLGYLRCEAIAVDLSREALELGRKVIEKDHLAKELNISYVPYDGSRIPLPDAHVERICCFDAFHHVADQKTTLREFFRIMRPGGIAAFHEPGPMHSRSRDAQYEMRNFGVIENDIYIEDIARMAKEIGFEDLQVACYTPTPLLLGVAAFNSLIASKLSRDDEHAIVSRIGGELRNMRIFFLYKPGEEVVDSRRGEGLECRITVNAGAREGDFLPLSATVHNAGTCVWLPSGGEPGCVRIGVQVWGENEALVSQDYARFDLSNTPVRPGESRTVTFRVPLPKLPRYQFCVDLVSEQVAWFGQIGASEPVMISSQGLAT